MTESDSHKNVFPDYSPGDRPDLNSLQNLFNARVDRLCKLKATCDGKLGDPWAKLIEIAMYSTYWDCRSLGMGDRAQELCHKNKVPSSMFTSNVSNITPKRDP